MATPKTLTKDRLIIDRVIEATNKIIKVVVTNLTVTATMIITDLKKLLLLIEDTKVLVVPETSAAIAMIVVINTSNLSWIKVLVILILQTSTLFLLIMKFSPERPPALL